MSLVRLIKNFKKYNKEHSRKEPTFAKIIVSDTSVLLDTDGVFFIAEINYSGNAFITQIVSAAIKTQFSKNKIKITRLFANKSFTDSETNPFFLFSHSGDLKVRGCQILTYSGKNIKATISTYNERSFINKNKTKLEDSTETILFEEYQDIDDKAIFATESGMNKKYIDSNAFNDEGKFQKTEIRTPQNVKSSIKPYSKITDKPFLKRERTKKVTPKVRRKAIPKAVPKKITKKGY